MKRPAIDLRGQTRYLTDGGLETTLLFVDGWDLPDFAAFPLLGRASGRDSLRAYYRRYLALAEQHRSGFVLETPTWRASSRWGRRLGYDAAALHALNTEAVAMMRSLRRECSPELAQRVVISGQIGPQDDGYVPAQLLSPEAAVLYHRAQIDSFALAGADMVCALTLTYTDEAIGIVRAAQAVGLPVAISFTVETDGRLPCGVELGEAIARVDAATLQGPAYYMLNCAHPDHLRPALIAGSHWLNRIGGLRANASRASHAELDAAESLDDGDPDEFGSLHRELKSMLPNLVVVGGCCGTDHRHVAAVADQCLAVR